MILQIYTLWLQVKQLLFYLLIIMWSLLISM